MAERLAAQSAVRTLGPGGGGWVFESAGTDTRPGLAMEKRSAEALRELGGDHTGFRSRVLGPGQAMDYDLVLTMSRRHRRVVLRNDPRAMRRTFTLLEARDLLSRVDERPRLPIASAGRAQELSRLLDAARAYREVSLQDDVPDPIGQPLDVHRQVGTMISEALDPLLAVLLAPNAHRHHLQTSPNQHSSTPRRLPPHPSTARHA
jgi:protein-tyrosine phosphatase